MKRVLSEGTRRATGDAASLLLLLYMAICESVLL